MRVSNDKRRNYLVNNQQSDIDVFFILNVSILSGVLLSKNDTSIISSHVHNVTHKLIKMQRC